MRHVECEDCGFHVEARLDACPICYAPIRATERARAFVRFAEFRRKVVGALMVVGGTVELSVAAGGGRYSLVWLLMSMVGIVILAIEFVS